MYSKWGYIFIAPFFVIYGIFSVIPLAMTIYYSFFEYYFSMGLFPVGPNFIGFANYTELLAGPFWQILGNTFIMWGMGFVPQIVISLLLAVWFTDSRLKLKGLGFFKSVIYMPNLVMASAFSMIFFMLFGQNGPIVKALFDAGIVAENFDIFDTVWGTRAVIGFMNFVMWTGNTTILLMAGIMGIDPTLMEAAEVDGASRSQIFFKITMPLLKPIFIFVLITSMLGGLQMYDVPAILTNQTGSPDNSNLTIMMRLQQYLQNSSNYGMSGAISVLLFIIGGAASLLVFRSLIKNDLVSLDKVGN
ncbi:MAG TPA: sugar ABC transporter permease [Acholeplasma sp.]|nr:sugar ABC transporter permease [Acholeplasma sp.]